MIIANIIRDSIFASINLDPISLSVIAFQMFLLVLVFTRGPLTAVGIIGWAIIFITKNSIPLVGLLLEHGHNDFINLGTYDILKPFIKVALGIVLWIIGVKISFEKVKSTE